MFFRKSMATEFIASAALAVLVSGSVFAQTAAPVQPLPAGSSLVTPAAATPPPKPAVAASKGPLQSPRTAEASAGPSWAELTPPQRAALAPLAAAWATINEPQKRKWLEISRNYPRLSPLEQTTMHSRMNEWVAMTPQQRAQARLNFAKTRELSTELTPDEKKAKWETYQALSPEEKKGLAAAAVPKPAGAATAVKPVPPQKLVQMSKNQAASAPGATAPGPASPATQPAVPSAPSAARP